MTLTEIQELIFSPTYDFLRTNPHLGDNLIFLTLGGSHAYGTNTDTSAEMISRFWLPCFSMTLESRNATREMKMAATSTATLSRPTILQNRFWSV